MSIQVELRDSIVALINQAAFESPVSALAATQAYYDLKDLTDEYKVNVVRGGRSRTIASRDSDQMDYLIHVGVMRQWGAISDEELECKFDEADGMVEQIERLIRNTEIGLPDRSATAVAFEIVPYSERHREENRQFAAEIIITLRRIETP
jgi:hypothetical protein